MITKITFDTPLGAMIALANKKVVCLLQFTDTPSIEKKILKVAGCKKEDIRELETAPLSFLKLEIQKYFQGKVFKFQTPIHLIGTDFQKLTWKTLLNINFGEKNSYGKIAKSIGRDSAFRAVANANAANALAIIVPCHRITNSNGSLGGYNGGTDRKKWLLDHEKRICLETSRVQNTESCCIN